MRRSSKVYWKGEETRRYTGKEKKLEGILERRRSSKVYWKWCANWERGGCYCCITVLFSKQLKMLSDYKQFIERAFDCQSAVFDEISENNMRYIYIHGGSINKYVLADNNSKQLPRHVIVLDSLYK